ncbi:hypothetical protein NIES4072_05810 [Nostoc commune NIES-4072]|uniref:Uncharacterized protein n=1 Tax=Nostoc commune NIES-4072 TaxID=2005467 RepID=A0A2R5FFS7_NOSCO|nr:hypothetical protein [Nostoc commune]BBD65741.1 hypothetical protein NIES4070_21020 [Nostoc commune HK-02]GBG16935.1 hypothetical protein NIES4072_05810 [Nostoc commune NIES-4072]
MDDTIIYPSYFRIFECRNGRWFIKNLEVFVTFSTTNHEDIKTLYGITEGQIVIELFRINGGKSGYYLANIQDKTYYYCVDRNGVKSKLLELGIGRIDPLESMNG